MSKLVLTPRPLRLNLLFVQRGSGNSILVMGEQGIITVLVKNLAGCFGRLSGLLCWPHGQSSSTQQDSGISKLENRLSSPSCLLYPLVFKKALLNGWIFRLGCGFLAFSRYIMDVEYPGDGRSCLQTCRKSGAKYLQGKVIPQGNFLTGGTVREFRERNRYGATP
jgi:hypothetical protein